MRWIRRLPRWIPPLVVFLAAYFVVDAVGYISLTIFECWVRFQWIGRSFKRTTSHSARSCTRPFCSALGCPGVWRGGLWVLSEFAQSSRGVFVVQEMASIHAVASGDPLPVDRRRQSGGMCWSWPGQSD